MRCHAKLMQGIWRRSTLTQDTQLFGTQNIENGSQVLYRIINMTNTKSSKYIDNRSKASQSDDKRKRRSTKWVYDWLHCASCRQMDKSQVCRAIILPMAYIPRRTVVWDQLQAFYYQPLQLTTGEPCMTKLDQEYIEHQTKNVKSRGSNSRRSGNTKDDN